MGYRPPLFPGSAELAEVPTHPDSDEDEKTKAKESVRTFSSRVLIA